MPRNSENIINAKLAECLRSKHPGWTVGSEQTDVLVNKLKQPDIVVSSSGGLTVVLETEYSPASSVEDDARARLGQTISRTGEELEQCVAVILPKTLRTADQRSLSNVVQQSRYQYAVFTPERDDSLYGQEARWPVQGWLEGTLDDLADCIETVALSERRVARGVKILELGVGQTAGFLAHRAPRYILDRLAEKLHQTSGEQTNRMVMAILANAVIFHMRLARLHPEIKELDFSRTQSHSIPKEDVLLAWSKILDINYWPIFKLASELLRIIPKLESGTVLDRLDRMAGELKQFGAADIQDLTGRMFQQLIADRKFLATFYTLPPSAAFLAELCISRLNVDWSDPDSVAALRIADLACGTGALLGATYHGIASRHRRSGGDDRHLHKAVMERVLTGADIMPAAVHLTATTLSGMHPDLPFGHTRIINMPYGDRANGDGVSIGSLDLIEASETRPVFGTGRTVLSGQGEKGDAEEAEALEVPHRSMDLVIMNPPFTRPTNHESANVPVPSFAGFRTKEDEQAKMSIRLRAVTRTLDEPAGHGNAGLASNFIDLAHAKLRPGGILGLVLPAVVVQGHAWKNTRRLLEKHYQDILIVGIATEGSTDRAFSADTGMAEVLLVATRKNADSQLCGKICKANLLTRPKTSLEAFVTARAVEKLRIQAPLEPGLIRQSSTQRAGSLFCSDDWKGVGIRSASVARFMTSLAQAKLMLPRASTSVSIPIVRLEEIGKRGLLDRDINGITQGQPRGPFDIEPLTPAPEYPILWSHDTERERRLIVAADSEGMPRPGCREQAARIWVRGASRLHYNRDFQVNSQALAACLTEEQTIGGPAWPNFLTKPAWEIPLALWANTTMGLIAFWWAGTRQQQGRSRLTISRLPQLLSLDVSSLTLEQLEKCENIFEVFQGRKFLPANEAYRDETRQALDQAILTEVFSLEESVMDNLAVLRRHWCEEPSVHGGKGTRPKP